MRNYVFDNFSDVFEFRNAITSRPENGHAGNASKESGESFAGMAYNKAVEAVTDGLPEVAGRLNRELTRFQKVACNSIPQRRPINYYNGYAPNVPAAIMGLPKSMRKTVKTPSKVKTVTLFYDSTANCGTSAETLEKAGAAVLQLTYWLELNGFRVRFTLTPFIATQGSDTAVCNVLLKDFRQPLDILKLSFSITSVSMFRRLGFKWIETVPKLTANWSMGYGHHIDDKAKAAEVLRKAGQDMDNGYFITVSDCESADFDAVKLAAVLGIKVG